MALLYSCLCTQNVAFRDFYEEDHNLYKEDCNLYEEDRNLYKEDHRLYKEDHSLYEEGHSLYKEDHVFFFIFIYVFRMINYQIVIFYFYIESYDENTLKKLFYKKYLVVKKNYFCNTRNFMKKLSGLTGIDRKSSLNE